MAGGNASEPEIDHGSGCYEHKHRKEHRHHALCLDEPITYGPVGKRQGCAGIHVLTISMGHAGTMGKMQSSDKAFASRSALLTRRIANVRFREDQVYLAFALLIGALVGLIVVAFILLTEHIGSRMYPPGGNPWRGFSSRSPDR